MFFETLSRVRGNPLIAFNPPLVVCGDSHRETVAQELADAGITDAMLLLEPMPRNTAAALCAAALVQAQIDPETLMLILPADHVIAKPTVLHDACLAATAAAEAGNIVTFAIVPEGPETGYGYIRQGAAIDAHVSKVAAFVEKPNLATARNYLASGQYAWNAGIFFFKASVLITELERLAPEILTATKRAVELAQRNGNIIELDAQAFAVVPSKSIDYAVMELTDNAAVISVDMGWNDVGSYATLYQLGEKDGNANVSSGPAALFDSSGCLVRSETLPVSLIGVSGLIVIVTPAGVLVTPMDRSQDVRLASDAFTVKPIG